MTPMSVLIGLFNDIASASTAVENADWNFLAPAASIKLYVITSEKPMPLKRLLTLQTADCFGVDRTGLIRAEGLVTLILSNPFKRATSSIRSISLVRKGRVLGISTSKVSSSFNVETFSARRDKQSSIRSTEREQPRTSFKRETLNDTLLIGWGVG